METMKKLFTLILAIGILAVNAQNNYERLQAAFSLSLASENAGDINKAIRTLNEVYNADSYEINLRLGWLYLKLGNFGESAKFYQNAIKLQPMSEEAKMGYVYAVAAMGNWDEVLKTYLEILKVNPYNTYVLYNTGLIYYNKGQYSQAYPYFEKLVNLYPFGYDGLLMFAWTNLKLGKYNVAKTLFQKVLLISPQDPSALEGLKQIK